VAQTSDHLVAGLIGSEEGNRGLQGCCLGRVRNVKNNKNPKSDGRAPNHS
jgi:hypothetical protein